ncbi:FeoA family protein [Abyssisolibacter fermentans]|uniref:FeoA family protein n=1 Tax=Abyssisolibacter fermentans TaxID=1766203 RepID=UPI000834602C|nr:FeoA family protein [Abyssisolibacter fermentans]
MPLNMVENGKTVKLKAIYSGSKLKKKLSDMGLTNGVEIKVLFGYMSGATVVNIRGSKVVLGAGISNKIMVECV